MHPQLDTIKKIRSSLLSLVEDLSLVQLNFVPSGFNNNIAWHLGHLVAAQQNVCYVRAGRPMHIDDAFFTAYKPGSKPEKALTETDLTLIRKRLFSTLEQTDMDYRSGLFANYEPWTTRYGGIDIPNIEGAFQFLPFHEGLHFGYVMALKRVVLQG